MKKMKQIAVVLLCLCILCGLPLAVGAADPISLQKAEVVSVTDAGVVVRATFSGKVNLWSTKLNRDNNLFCLQSQADAIGDDGTNVAVWQMWKHTTAYVGGQEIGGKTYSNVLELTFPFCHDNHKTLWFDANGEPQVPAGAYFYLGDNGKNPDGSDYITEALMTGENGARINRTDEGNQFNIMRMPAEDALQAPITLDSAVVTAANADGYTIEATFSAPVTVPNKGSWIVMNQPSANPHSATVCQNWQIQSMEYVGDTAGTNYSSVLRLNFKYCVDATHQALWKDAETGLYKVPDTGIFEDGIFLCANDFAKGHAVGSGLMSTTVIHGEDDRPVAITTAINPGAGNEYGVVSAALENRIPAPAEPPLSVKSATILDADDPDKVQFLVTFTKPATMNISAPNWAIMMRFGIAANGAGNKQMSSFEYVDPTTGADGKEYATQILFTFPKADSMPLSGKVGIAFAEYNFPDGFNDDTVSPDIISDEKGNGLQATDLINNASLDRMGISFTIANLAADAQEILTIIPKNETQVTVDFGMLVQSIDISKGITLGSRTVTAAQPEGVVSDNYGTYGSARWTLTLDGLMSDQDTLLTIPANAVTTPYNNTVVAKDMTITMVPFKAITIDKMVVNGESTMTLTSADVIEQLENVAASVRALKSDGTIAAEMMLTLTQSADDQLIYIAAPDKAGNYRTFSSIWQFAADNGYTLVFAITYSGMDYVNTYPLTVDDYEFDPSPFTVTKVTQSGEHTLLVKFNHDFIITGVDNARQIARLRMINPTTGTVIYFKDDAGKTIHMQWDAIASAYYEKDGQPMKDTLELTFADSVDISMLLNKVNLSEEFKNYPIVLCLEEAVNIDTADKGNHVMYNIRRDEDGDIDGKQLDVTKYKHSSGALGDYVLVEVSEVAEPSFGVAIDKVEVLDQTRIVVTFNKPVVFKNPAVAIRLVNDKNQTKTNDAGRELFWTGTTSYYNDEHTQMLFVLHDDTLQKNNAVIERVDGLDELFNAGYEDSEYKLKLTFLDHLQKPSRKMDGVVVGVTGEDGSLMMSDLLNGLDDAVSCNIDSTQIPQGELAMTDVTIISDLEAVITFSAPIEIADRPYLGIRILNDKNQLLFRTAAGEIVFVGKDAEGNPTTPLQGQSTWSWYNDEHTQVLIKLTSGVEDAKTFVDMVNTDWDAIYPGARLTIGIEENHAPVIQNNNRIENIYLVSDPRVTLTANKFDGGLDGIYIEPNIDYTPKNVTMSASVINDMQVRITFSHDVELKGKTWFTIRYIDPKTGVSAIWGDDGYNRTLVQFSGTWEWENNSKRSIIWTMNGNNLFGACNLADLAAQKGALALFKGYPLVMTVQEVDSEEYKVSSKNGRIENFVTLDGKDRLAATAVDAGLDFAYAGLNTKALSNVNDIQLLEVNAIDDQTLELVFSEEIVFGTDDKLPTFTLRYLNPTGESEVLVNGKVANFKGTIAIKEGDAKVLIWKLKSGNADSLTDILNYNGNLKWNKGARVCMIVENASEGIPTYTKRMWGIYSTDRVRTLAIEYMKEPNITMDINVLYDLPAPEQTTTNEVVTVTEYYSNYLPFILASAGMVVVGLAMLIVVLIGKRKKEEK